MKSSIKYINRLTGKLETEKVYGDKALQFLYGSLLGKWINFLITSNPCFSNAFGWWQKQTWTKKNIIPFIKSFEIDSSEFLHSPESFQSFNDFFIRRLKENARPIAPGENLAVLPADARYLFFSNIAQNEGFIVKGKKFSLRTLLQNDELAKRYARGSMVLARLCPTDYHRYHFPVSCTPNQSKLINGKLYSVNPIALRQNICILSENKRSITSLKSEAFGRILFIEVGAANVGSIHNTYTPNQSVAKGEEKGYFSFGASSIILLFEPDSITFDNDLLNASKQRIEIRGLMGQSMGISK